MKTRDCAECRHFEYASYSTTPTCLKKHKLRYHAPRTESHAIRGDFGWKRRCNDFEEAK